jgi:hypothetical protein
LPFKKLSISFPQYLLIFFHVHQEELVMIRTQVSRVLWFCFSSIIFCNDVVFASLLEGTLVATAHGLVPIQNLKVGDKVLGYDLNEPDYDKAICEVAVTKINKHITDALFTMCTKDGWVEASPHQLIFTFIPEEAQNGDAHVMDFVQAQEITKSCMLIDAHMNCLAIVETNKLKLSCSYPEQYIEKVKRNRHKKVIAVVRLIVNADVYALEVEEPHVFLIAENPHATDISKTRLLLTHNGLPALAVGVSMAFDATPASLAFAEATATVGGMSVIFGPVGLTLGVLTSVGFLGYQLFKKDANKQPSFYIERAGPGSPGGMEPKEPKDKKEKKEAKPKTATPNTAEKKAAEPEITGATELTKDPSTFVGRRGRFEPQFLNKSQRTIIYGREYSAHAIERIQQRGLTPMAIENTIKEGVVGPGRTPNEVVYFDSTNNIKVVTESTSGRVITVMFNK